MYAAIDIGSNTVLLLVAEYTDSNVTVIFEKQKAPRLGEGVDKTKRLDQKTIQRVLNVLIDYRKELSSRFPDLEQVFVTATSAVRDSQNRDEFVEKVKKYTGFEVRILSGLEEAEYTYKGAVNVLTEMSSSMTVIDIGGGSTEISSGSSTELKTRHSFDMGCVRFTERYLRSDPPGEEEISACRAAIRNNLEDLPHPLESANRYVAVAGTATSLAYIDLEMDSYESQKINGHTINRHNLAELVKSVANLSSSELLQQYPEVMEGRSDIFLAGLLILEEFMKHSNREKLVVSTGGIRHGVIIDSVRRG